MNPIAFRGAVTILLVTMVVLVGVIGAQIGSSPEVLAQRAKKEKEESDIKKAVELVEAEQREYTDWCRANDKPLKQILHLAVTKLEIDPGRLPVARATIPYPIWQGLDKSQRDTVNRAIRCHSKYGITGFVEIIDVNGIVTALF